MDEIARLDAPKCIISTDSRSCLQALHNIKLGHRLIVLVIRNYIFCPLPIKRAFYGIRLNGKENITAKAALDLPHTKLGVPYTEFKHSITQYIPCTGQTSLNQASSGRLAVLL